MYQISTLYTSLKNQRTLVASSQLNLWDIDVVSEVAEFQLINSNNETTFKTGLVLQLEDTDIFSFLIFH